jgi:pimeloyl-ACP methyl ester carboxylesterase
MFRNFIRLLVNLVIAAFVFMVIILLIFDQFVQFRMDDKDLYAIFHSEKLYPTVAYYSAGGRRIRYLSVGSDTTCCVLFIHGAPSSLSYWRNYLMDSALLHNARMYAVDRPGYGYSGLADPIPDIHQQALLLKPLLDSMRALHHPIVLVGASYGTAVASRLVMDNPGVVDGLVLIAPAIAPGEEKIFWFTPAIEHPWLRWFIPRMLQSANTEKIHHKAELEKMLPLWSSIHIPVTYLQGSKDELVYPSNANFARTHLVNASPLTVHMIPGKGHLIAFSNKPEVEAAILDMIGRVSATSVAPLRLASAPPHP